MANKFTQSVLQRLEQEQKVQPKTKSQTKTITKKTAEIKIPISSSDIIESNPDIISTSIQASMNETDMENTVSDIPDISDYLRLESARTAKNKTFYLDVEVIDALCAAARRQHVTDSKLCNDILRRVLGVGGTR